VYLIKAPCVTAPATSGATLREAVQPSIGRVEVHHAIRFIRLCVAYPLSNIPSHFSNTSCLVRLRSVPVRLHPRLFPPEDGDFVNTLNVSPGKSDLYPSCGLTPEARLAGYLTRGTKGDLCCLLQHPRNIHGSGQLDRVQWMP